LRAGQQKQGKSPVFHQTVAIVGIESTHLHGLLTLLFAAQPQSHSARNKRHARLRPMGPFGRRQANLAVSRLNAP
jgi:hypothetical protein